MNFKGDRKLIPIILSLVIVLLLVLSFPFGFPSGSLGSGHAKTQSPMVAGTYNITFIAKGLQKSSSWYVEFNYGSINTTGLYHNFTGVANGTYQFRALDVPGAKSTYQYVPNPSSGTITVNGKNLVVEISYYNKTISLSSPSTYQVRFVIQNFPSMMPGINWYWQAMINGVTVTYGPAVDYNASSTLHTLHGLENGTYHYSINSAIGTLVSPSSGYFTINGHNITLTFSLTVEKQQLVSFHESGLPSTTTFYVSLYNRVTSQGFYNSTIVSASNTVNFRVFPSSYSYYISSSNSLFSPSPVTGTLFVSNSSLNIPVTFSSSPIEYSILFRISNLPVNAPSSVWSWDIYMNGTYYGPSDNSTILVTGVRSGTYIYGVVGSGITINPSQGTVTVSGKSVTVYLKVVQEYPVLFKVNGLSNAYSPYWNWAVYINGTTYGNTNSGTMLIELPAGSYSFGIYEYGISFSKLKGNFTLTSAGTTVQLQTLPTWNANFIVTNGANLVNVGYSLTISHTYSGVGGSSNTYSTYSDYMTLNGFSNGTYYYSISPDPGFSVSSDSGQFTISGHDVNVSMKGAYVPYYPVQFNENGLVGGSSPTVYWGAVLDNGVVYNDSVKGLPTNSVPSTIIIYLPNGTYNVQAYVEINGHYYMQSPSKITVSSGSNIYTFQFSTGPAGSSLFNLSPTVDMIIVGVVVGVGALLTGIAVGFRRGSGGSSGKMGPGESGP